MAVLINDFQVRHSFKSYWFSITLFDYVAIKRYIFNVNANY